MSGLIEYFQSVFDTLVALPVLLLLVLGLPLAVLALTARIYPHTPFALACLVPLAFSVALLFQQDMMPLVLAADAALVLFATYDLTTLPRKRSFNVHRECQRTASLNKDHLIHLRLDYLGKSRVLVKLRDDLSEDRIGVPAEFSCLLEPRSRTTFTYQLRCKRRGAQRVEHAFAQVRSRFGFWKKMLVLDCFTQINVYPDMQQLSKYALLARTNRLSMMGVRRTRKIGQDNEFERLRDYTPDDNYRHIDWRSTARRRKLTVKDFQSNQSQRILFLIDCGRMMTNHAAGLSLLDHALNSMLMLSYVALRQGDAAGLLCFSDRIHSYVPPRSGMHQMNQLLHASYDRFPDLVESRYDEAFLHLSTTCRKRSLVVLITNVVDEVNAHQIYQYLGQTAQRHLPLGILLRDRQLFDAADQEMPSGTGLFESAAACEILTWRHQVLNSLHHQGVLVLDTFPEEMTAPLVNQYLEIKARHLL